MSQPSDSVKKQQCKHSWQRSGESANYVFYTCAKCGRRRREFKENV